MADKVAELTKGIDKRFFRSPVSLLVLLDALLIAGVVWMVTELKVAAPAVQVVAIGVMAAATILTGGIILELMLKRPQLAFGPEEFKEEANFLRYHGMADDSADRLRQYWRPDGETIEPDHNTELLAWMRKNDIRNVSVRGFLTGENYAAARQKACRDLGLV